MSTITCPRCAKGVDAGSQYCIHCGTELAPSGENTVLTGQGGTDVTTGWDSILSTLREATEGRYEIEATLGQGGMGAVYRARDLVLDNTVAIKVMLPGGALDPQLVERFRQEARTIAGLRHPNIVTVHDLRQHGGLHFFILDYIPGRSLDAIIARSGRLPIAVVRLWLTQVASALDLAHRRGIVHRDIKPGNILIDTDGNAILTDFGIAKLQVSPKWKTATGGFLGTPHYASPEQWKGLAITAASDQYSLGIVAYAMLAGTPPFDGESISDLLLAHTGETPETVGTLRPDCPPDLSAAVHRMLEKDPRARWPSMRDVMSTLGSAPPPDDPAWAQAASLATGQSVAVDPEGKTWETPLPRPASRSLVSTVTQWFRPRRRRYALGGAAAVTAALVFFVGFPRAQPASIALSDTALDLTPGDTAPVQAVVLDAAGDTLASNVQWTTADGAVASVTDDGRVVALREGTTSVRARAGRIERTVAVSVGSATSGPTSEGGVEADRRGSDDTAVDATGLSLDLAQTSVRVGDSLRPTVTFLGEGNRSVGTASRPEFTAENPRVVHVSPSGWVVAVGAGTTQLLARAGALEARAALSVIPVAPTLSTVSAGAEHTCGATSDGTVYCWGRNDRGQVAPGLAALQPLPFPRRGSFAAVSAGGTHTCALQRDQSILCWGGLATPAGRFRSLTTGLRHACAITGSGSTACWGANDRGQLGDGTTGTRSVDQAIQGDLSFDMIAAGAEHTCGLLGGRAFCWGDDASGQTGTGTLDRGFITQPTEVEGDHGYLTFLTAGTHHTCVLTRIGAALCWGANDQGQLGDGSKQSRHAPRPLRPPMGGARGATLTFEMLSAGETHTCGITQTQRLYCWGDNRLGQLGDGTNVGRVVPVRVSVDEAFTWVSAGRAHTCAVSASGKTWCWGANGGGQLGDGTSTNRPTPVVPGRISGT